MTTRARFFFCWFCIVLATFAACTQDPEEAITLPDDEPMEETSADSISYLALGDSYTIGQGVPASERWPNQLGEWLMEEDKYVVAPIKIIAQTGWTTANLNAAIDNSNLETYDLVSLLIGVNNQFQGQSLEQFQTGFEASLSRAIALAVSTDRLFVVSIPDYGVTPFGASNSEAIAEELDAYNAHMAQRCAELDIAFINITEISRMLGDSPGALAPDNLHPSGEQYADWVEKMLPVVGTLLEE